MRANLTDHAYRFLLKEMMTNNLAGGARLSEVELATKADISRTPIREAFRRLESIGLVKQVANRGVFVETLTPGEYEDVLEVRELLESFAAGKAAELITPEQIRELDSSCRVHLELAFEARKTNGTGEDVEQISRSLEADLHFHRTILGSCGNSRLIRIVDSLTLVSLVLGRLVPEDFKLDAADRYERAYREHSLIAAALKDRNPTEASRLAAEHVRRARQLMMAQYKAGHHAATDPVPISPKMMSQISERLIANV